MTGRLNNNNNDGSSVFSFLRNARNGCSNLYSHPQCSSVLIFPHPLQHLVFVDFLTTILNSVKWYFIVVLICISLIASDVEHPFMCLFAMCMSSVVKCLFRSFAHFLIGLLVFLILSYMRCFYILEINSLSVISLQIFSPILRLSFCIMVSFALQIL